MGFLSGLFGPKKPKVVVPIIDIKKRFDLLGRMGQGSMSKVWRARDGKIGRVVCLKILDPIKTAKFDARFPGLIKPSEGAICMTLHHKNVVKTFEHAATKQREPFLVMELIEGDGLNFQIETRSPKLQGNRVNLLIQIADGLEYIHAQKYLHRDLCPRNIMVTQEGVVKIIDFGLTIPYTTEFCRPGNRTGTADYLAPELIKRVVTDHRVDLFALGVTAYETFLGTLPWEKARGSMEILQKHLNVPGRDPRDVQPKLEPELVQFLLKGIDRDRDKRFQTAGEFREALKALPRQDY